MLREITNGFAALLTLAVLLLVGCSDDRAPARAEQAHKEKAGRLFDTQRSALEQAKGVADAAGLRNQQFQGRTREID